LYITYILTIPVLANMLWGRLAWRRLPSLLKICKLLRNFEGQCHKNSTPVSHAHGHLEQAYITGWNIFVCISILL
jgi:hypothetical protein